MCTEVTWLGRKRGSRLEREWGQGEGDRKGLKQSLRSEKLQKIKQEEGGWSMWNSCGFANWCLLTLGPYKGWETGLYPQVLAGTNGTHSLTACSFFGLVHGESKVILGIQPWAARNYASVCSSLHGPRLKASGEESLSEGPGWSVAKERSLSELPCVVWANPHSCKGLGIAKTNRHAKEFLDSWKVDFWLVQGKLTLWFVECTYHRYLVVTSLWCLPC
jgi:hypothetical protein